MTESADPAAKAIDRDARHDADHAEALPTDLPTVKSRKVVTLVAVLVAVLGVLFLLGFVPEQSRKAAALAEAEHAGSATPVVNVVLPTRQPNGSALVLPGNAVALQSTLIFPR